jgi:hypothetical protein
MTIMADVPRLIKTIPEVKRARWRVLSEFRRP